MRCLPVLKLASALQWADRPAIGVIHPWLSNVSVLSRGEVIMVSLWLLCPNRCSAYPVLASC